MMFWQFIGLEHLVLCQHDAKQDLIIKSTIVNNHFHCTSEKLLRQSRIFWAVDFPANAPQTQTVQRSEKQQKDKNKTTKNK